MRLYAIFVRHSKCLHRVKRDAAIRNPDTCGILSDAPRSSLHRSLILMAIRM